MIAIIYLIGVWISFHIVKTVDRKVCEEEGKEYTWNDVFFNILIGTLSWFLLVFILIWSILKYITSKKPPKWL